MRILHAALPDEWTTAAANGSYDRSTRGVGLVDQGYIHASTAAQLPGVLDRWYADVPQVDVLVIDLDRLEHEGGQVLWEDAPGSTEGPYPHVYGVLPAHTVTAVVRIEHQPGTAWAVPPIDDVAGGPPPP